MSANQVALDNDVIRKYQELNDKLGELKAKSEIEITDQQSLIASANVKLDLESYIRAAENHFEPQLAPAEETVRRLKLQMSTLIAPAKQWLQGVINRQRAFATQEKEKARREQDEINRKATEEQDKINAKAREEARKKHVKIPEPVAATVVIVKPSIPTVAGIRNQTYYYGDLTDGGNAILLAFAQAIVAKDGDRVQFLQRFLQINTSEVGKFARDTKDNAKAASLLPGVNFYSKG